MSRPQIQPNGTVQYTKKGDPPPELRGYRRKNSNPASSDAWVFIPDFPPCTYRDAQLYQRGCGDQGVQLMCNRTGAVCTHENWKPCEDINPPSTS